MPREHKYTTKIYYEDTDAGGVVYYANYFKFIERARSEMIYDLLSINLSDLKRDFDILFVVKKLTAEFHKPIKFEDKIDVITNIIRKTPVSKKSNFFFIILWIRLHIFHSAKLFLKNMFG